MEICLCLASISIDDKVDLGIQTGRYLVPVFIKIIYYSSFSAIIHKYDRKSEMITIIIEYILIIMKMRARVTVCFGSSHFPFLSPIDVILNSVTKESYKNHTTIIILFMTGADLIWFTFIVLYSLVQRS